MFSAHFLHAGFAVGITSPPRVRSRVGPCPGARWTNAGKGQRVATARRPGPPPVPSEPARRDAASTAQEAAGEIPAWEPGADPGRPHGRTSWAGRLPPNEKTGNCPGTSLTHPAGRVPTVTHLCPLGDGGGRLTPPGTPLSNQIGRHAGRRQSPGPPDVVTVSLRASPWGPEGCPRLGGCHTHPTRE